VRWYTPLYLAEIRAACKACRKGQRPAALWIMCTVMERMRTSEGNENGSQLRYGQAYISTIEFDDAGITRRTARTVLDRLKAGHILALETTKAGTIVTVLEPERYMWRDPRTGQPTDHESPTKPANDTPDTTPEPSEDPPKGNRHQTDQHPANTRPSTNLKPSHQNKSKEKKKKKKRKSTAKKTTRKRRALTGGKAKPKAKRYTPTSNRGGRNGVSKEEF